MSDNGQLGGGMGGKLEPWKAINPLPPRLRLSVISPSENPENKKVSDGFVLVKVGSVRSYPCHLWHRIPGIIYFDDLPFAVNVPWRWFG